MENQFPSSPLLFSSLVFILILFKIFRNSQKKTTINYNHPPGPTKLPLIGNLHLFSSASSYPIHHRLRDLSKEYGGVMHLRLGQVSTVVIGTPEAAKQIFKTHDVCFADRPRHAQSSAIVTYNFTDIAYSPYADYWRQLRKICIVELLSPKRVQSFRSIREEEVANLIRDISLSSSSSSSGDQNNKPFNLSRRIFSLTYSITAKVSFGDKCKEQDAFISAAEKIMQTTGFDLADLYPSIKFLASFSEMKPRLISAHQDADRIIGNIINDHRRANRKSNDIGETDDILDVLLRLQEHGNLQFPLTDDNIKAVVLDLFVAGSETSSTTVEWAMSETLKNPRVLSKAQAELRKVFDKKGKVDEEGLQQVHYLKLIIKETLRLHPPGPLLLPRECRESCEIDGYHIPAKTKVIVNAWALARDPNHWSDPDTFYPERFLDSQVDYKGNHFEFIPFGAGRRICPGISFATPNIELPLANFLYHFDWKLPGEVELENLDMGDSDFGTTVRRKTDLLLIPVPYHPPTIEA